MEDTFSIPYNSALAYSYILSSVNNIKDKFKRPLIGFGTPDSFFDSFEEFVLFFIEHGIQNMSLSKETFNLLSAISPQDVAPIKKSFSLLIDALRDTIVVNIARNVQTNRLYGFVNILSKLNPDKQPNKVNLIEDRYAALKMFTNFTSARNNMSKLSNRQLSSLAKEVAIIDTIDNYFFPNSQIVELPIHESPYLDAGSGPIESIGGLIYPQNYEPKDFSDLNIIK